MSRMLAVVLGVFVATVFIVAAVNIMAALIIIALLAAAAVFTYIRNRGMIFIGMCAASVFALLFFAAHFYLIERPVLALAGASAEVRADIRGVRRGLFFTRFELRVIEVGGESLGRLGRFAVHMTVYDIISAEIGDIFEAYLSFSELSGEDYGFYKSRGIFIAAEVGERDGCEDEQVRIVRTGSRGLAYHINNLQEHVQEVFYRHIKGSYHDRVTQEAAVAYGVFTGITHDISARTRNYFRRNGIGHVLSVSGLHLSILAAICAFMLRTAGVNKKISAVFIILFSIAFTAFAGFAVSAVRAAVMITLFYTAFLLERKSDAVTSLMIAGFLIILPNPYHVLGVGFQLSFGATFGIIFTQGLNAKILEKIDSKILKISASSVFITFSSTVFTLPVLAYNFRSLSLISPVTNLITSWFAYFILFCALMLSLFSFINIAVNIAIILEFFGWLLYRCVGALISICRFLASFEHSYISTENTVSTHFHLFSLIFLLACVLLAAFFKREKLRPYLCIFASLSLGLLVASQVYPRVLFADGVRFAYFSDYRNQNIILFQGGSVDIIDMTHGFGSPAFATHNIMRANGAVNINSIILTHYHRRHAGMISRFASRSNINRVYVPEIASELDAEVFNSLYFLSRRLGFELLNYGNALRVGDVLIARGVFDYNRMLHFWVDINYRHVNLLYLGIGYESGFRAHLPRIFYTDYDIIFYGSHKHNFRTSDWVAGVYASFAGVLSQYMSRVTGAANSYRFGREILEKYIERGNLFYASGDTYSHIVFAVDRDGRIEQHFMR